MIPELLAIVGDAADANNIKRITQLRELEIKLSVFAFERTYSEEPNPSGLQILAKRGRGLTLKRMVVTFWGFVRLISALRGRTVARTWARDLDLALLTLVFFPRTKLVYEILDLHPAMYRQSAGGFVLKWLHNWTIARAEYVVTSSMCFVDDERLTKDYRRKIHLIENKIYANPQILACLAKRRTAALQGLRLVRSRPHVVCAGRFRCIWTLDTLRWLASQELIELSLHGIPEDFANDAFDRLLQIRSVSYYGPFKNPEQLPDVYTDADIAWALIDDGDGNTNSRLLLPNRVYEACYYLVPVVVRSGTCLADFVADKNLGWALDRWDNDALLRFFGDLSRHDIDAAKQNLARRPVEDFVFSDQERNVLRHLTAPPSTGGKSGLH